MKKLLAVFLLIFSAQSFADLASDLADPAVSLDQTVINALAANEPLGDIALALLNDGQSLNATTQALVSNSTSSPTSIATALFTALNNPAYTSNTVVSPATVSLALQNANVTAQAATVASTTGQTNALFIAPTTVAGPVGGTPSAIPFAPAPPVSLAPTGLGSFGTPLVPLRVPQEDSAFL